MKIRRIVAIESAMANALIIHSLCDATLPPRTWTKPLPRARRNRPPKSPMITRSAHPENGITSPKKRAVTPTTTPIETSTLPAQRW
jgi:hypothetical protein